MSNVGLCHSLVTINMRDLVANGTFEIPKFTEKLNSIRSGPS